ncbi:diacylglycerol/lipid kinase family protein [Allopontixanthobacter sp.]|uniref:diacylglycerol/lipid kinase family protein n=1 Tax=Allopontixanthobacter sp. TaxID=2906452 RepID=UPI002ABD0B45|nr:diacylglycerol kinase family protein [Allopontixanthobacter sp.]MDZ4306882.1 diacylglycerol kinase family protein [Allopontixanthobacter sp.]
MTFAKQQFPPLPEWDGTPRPAPVVGVIYNRHSHHNLKRRHPAEAAADLPVSAGGHPADVIVAEPAGHGDLPATLADFKRRGVELLVMNGGDGTVRDVLSSGLKVWGDDWPALAVLPRGKTNALNVDLGAPADWTLAGVIAAFEQGRRVHRRGIVMTPLPASGSAEDSPPPMMGFILGAGAFKTGIKAGQDAHRLGAFNSLAVGVTAVWGVAQALLGSTRNRWRRGTGMQLLLGPNRDPMPHSGFGDPAQRWILIASTLGRLPLGMKLFGPYRDGLRVTVMDKARRRTLAMVPAIVVGNAPGWIGRSGVHFARADEFELTLDDGFILDGEIFPAGRYHVTEGPELHFVVP